MFLARWFLSPWWWRQYIPLKHRFIQEARGKTSLKMAFFIVTSVKTSNLTCHIYSFYNLFSSFRVQKGVSHSPLHEIYFWRMVSSGMLRHVALVRTDVSEELSAFFIRVTRIGELGTTLAVTSNRRTLRRNTKDLTCYFFTVCVSC
jgi:hypothetical protein